MSGHNMFDDYETCSDQDMVCDMIKLSSLAEYCLGMFCGNTTCLSYTP